MWKKFLMKCKNASESLARWYCDGKDITKEELKMAKGELFFYVMLLLLALCSLIFVQVAVAQEGFILTTPEMEELERLLEGLKRENEQLMVRSEGLTSLAERLKEALAMRDESLSELQSSYDVFEKEVKMKMSKMSSEIIEKEVKIKGLKRKLFVVSTLLFLTFFVVGVYVVMKLKKGG